MLGLLLRVPSLQPKTEARVKKSVIVSSACRPDIAAVVTVIICT